MTAGSRREKGTGGITRMKDGRYRAYLTITPDPADGSRRRVSAVGRTRTQALDRAKARARDIEAGRTDPKAVPTVGEWLDQWVTDAIEPRRAPNTTRSYRTRIRIDIRPLIGAIRLDMIRPSHIRRIENRILAGDPKTGTGPRSSKTADVTLSILRTAFDDAMAEGIVDHNPVRMADRVETEAEELPMLSPVEAAKLIRTEPDRKWRLMWRLLFVTGMRLGEMLAISRRELVERDGVACLNVEWQLKEFEKDVVIPPCYRARHLEGRLWLTRPKTRRGRRLIPLPHDLAMELKAYMTTVDVPDDTPVFRSKRNRPFSRDAVRNAWIRALDGAGLPRVRIHSARHTNATILAMNGVPDLVRKSLIGHSDIATTDAVYTHVDTKALAGAIDGVERLIGS